MKTSTGNDFKFRMLKHTYENDNVRYYPQVKIADGFWPFIKPTWRGLTDTPKGVEISDEEEGDSFAYMDVASILIQGLEEAREAKFKVFLETVQNPVKREIIEIQN